MELNDLKTKYAIVEKKYKLASFEKLNEDFEIDKIDKESELIVRVIRKVMMEKIINSLNFLEMLINPSNTSRMYLPYIRSMPLEDRTTIEEIYNLLGDVSLESLELEIDYSEKGEADMIKKVVSAWDSIKPKFRKIVANIKKPAVATAKKEKSYFG